MPRVTALRPAWPGHVLVELDGERCRSIRGESLIIECTQLPQTLDCDLGLGVGNTLAGEDPPDVRLRAVAPDEGAGRRVDG